MSDAFDQAKPVEGRRQPFVRGWRLLAIAALLAFVALVVIRTFIVDLYYIPSDSMQPALEPGDRILVNPTGHTSDIERGDIVVFDGTGSFNKYVPGNAFLRNPLKEAGQWAGLAGSDTVYVKRVIGVAGDTVACCDANGKLIVNGVPQDEPYIFGTDVASTDRFIVTVPEGRIWVMGDHRSVSIDSRALIGAPGGGFIKTEKIIGEPTRIIWPLNRAGRIESQANTQ